MKSLVPNRCACGAAPIIWSIVDQRKVRVLCPACGAASPYHPLALDTMDADRAAAVAAWDAGHIAPGATP